MSTHRDSRQAAQDDPSAVWADFKMWHYTPSIPAAVIFLVLFTTITAYHTFLLIRRKTWFCIPFVVGGLFEIIGYIGRTAAHNALDNVPLYAVQSLSLLLAPILFAASIYMILGRIIRGVRGESYSIIRITWLTKIFVGGDVICLLVQSGGGGMLAAASTKSQIDLCNNIVLGGLILQIVIFAVFLFAAVVFHRRMDRRPTDSAINGPLGVDSRVASIGKWTPGRSVPGWKRLMLVLYVTSALVTLRNLFRVVEYGMGWEGYLLNHEWVLYVFDAMLMFGVLCICVVCYDERISKGVKMGRGKSLTVSSDEMVVLEGGDGKQEVVQVNEQGRGPWS